MFNTLLKQSLIQAVGRIGGLVIGLISIGLLARYLGQTGFGWYMTAFSWLQLFAIVVDFGLYMVGLKLLGEMQDRKQELFSQLFWLRLFSAVVLVLLAPLCVWLFPYAVEVKIATTIISWSFFFASLNQLLTVSFQEELRMRWVALGELLGKLGALLALGVVIWFDAGFAWAIASVIVYGIVQFLLLYRKRTKTYTFSWVWRVDLILRILREAWPLGLIIILNTIYFKADIVILSWARPAAEVGLYGAAYKILEILVSFPAMYLGLLLPHISEWWSKKDLYSIRQYAQKSFNVSGFVAVPMIVGTLMLAEPIMVLIAGSDFIVAGIWLRVLVVATACIFYGQLFGYVLVGIGRQKIQLIIFSIVAGLALVLYGVYIPQYGSWAAALVTLLAEIIAMVLLGGMVVKYISWYPSVKQTLYYVFSGLVMAGVIYALLMYVWWWFAGMIGVLVYVTLLALLGKLDIVEVVRMIKFS